jgi:hypothetical protein
MQRILGWMHVRTNFKYIHVYYNSFTKDENLAEFFTAIGRIKVSPVANPWNSYLTALQISGLVISGWS